MAGPITAAPWRTLRSSTPSKHNVLLPRKAGRGACGCTAASAFIGVEIPPAAADVRAQSPKVPRRLPESCRLPACSGAVYRRLEARATPSPGALRPSEGTALSASFSNHNGDRVLGKDGDFPRSAPPQTGTLRYAPTTRRLHCILYSDTIRPYPRRPAGKPPPARHADFRPRPAHSSPTNAEPATRNYGIRCNHAPKPIGLMLLISGHPKL